MLDRIPDPGEMQALLGEALYGVWEALQSAIEAKYDMERLWDKGYRQWIYEYKYRRGGKTLCTLYAGENAIGIQIIFGRAEREKFEARRAEYPEAICRQYDEAPTFHDGKWVMYRPEDLSMINDLVRILEIKRRPNRK